MPSRAARRFEDGLDKLFAERTHWLRGLVRRRSPGRPPTFNRKKVQRRIRQLQENAESALVGNVFRPDFDKLYDSRHYWRAGGRRGIPIKRKAFGRFWEEKIRTHKYIYLFWEDGTCRYVGRTGRSRRRPQTHFTKPWFRSVSRIDVYSSRTASALPKLECLAVHRFQPTENRVRPANRKWSKKCPICKTRREIRQEVKQIFRLR